MGSTSLFGVIEIKKYFKIGKSMNDQNIIPDLVVFDKYISYLTNEYGYDFDYDTKADLQGELYLKLVQLINIQGKSIIPYVKTALKNKAIDFIRETTGSKNTIRYSTEDSSSNKEEIGKKLPPMDYYYYKTINPWKENLKLNDQTHKSLDSLDEEEPLDYKEFYKLDPKLRKHKNPKGEKWKKKISPSDALKEKIRYDLLDDRTMKKTEFGFFLSQVNIMDKENILRVNVKQLFFSELNHQLGSSGELWGTLRGKTYKWIEREFCEKYRYNGKLASYINEYRKKHKRHCEYRWINQVKEALEEINGKIDFINIDRIALKLELNEYSIGILRYWLLYMVYIKQVRYRIFGEKEEYQLIR